MKKIITIIFTSLSVLIVLDSMNFSHTIMMFLLAGVIPGTNITIDGAQMLELIALIAGFTLARVMTFAIRNIKPHTLKASQANA